MVRGRSEDAVDEARQGIPKGFPERNGGVAFMLGAQAATITRDWLNELHQIGAGRHGPDAFTEGFGDRDICSISRTRQCRSKESICENGALLWHFIGSTGSTSCGGSPSEMCGFVP